MKLKQGELFKILIMCLLSICVTSYIYESEQIFNKESHDFRALVDILDNIEDISELESGIVYEDTIYEELFNNIEDINYSLFVYSKIRSIDTKLEWIADLKEDSIDNESFKYLKRVSKELNEYVDDFNNHRRMNFFEIYILRKRFDKNEERLMSIFNLK